jgi:minor extracellular serine protease Vpr
MTSLARRHIVALAIATTFVTVMAPISAMAAPPSNSDSTESSTSDASTALVELKGAPVATATTVDRKGKRANLDGAKTKAYRATLSAQRNEFKKWLQANAPKAKITGSFDVSLNAVSVTLNGTSLDVLRTAPQVVTAQYSGLYHPTDGVDPDLALINAVQAWGAGGAEGAGAGIKVAIIDTGIQQDHPCFDDMGDEDGPNNYTNDKVIVAKVFANKAASLGFDAKAVQDHGTHVAGTVACDFGTTATVDGVVIPHTISGVAPAALLGSYNVFPGTIDDARSEDILNALDAAYADGMDVANLSLGGDAHGVQDLLTHAVDNLDKGGMVMAISAGNEGPGSATLGSPGSAASALTAGASSVAHQVAYSISTAAGQAIAVAGDFGPVTPGPLGKIDVIEGTGPDGVAALAGVSQACEPIPAATTTGLAAVIARGTCDFTVKMRNVLTAGYSSAIVINRVEGVLAMGTNGEPDQPVIPSVMISLTDAPLVLGASAVGQAATLNDPSYFNPYGVANLMADFSSEGPTDVDYRIKPDLVAPGVNVLSSVTGGGFAFFNGTSMASPHLAGAAAVVLGQHPTWQPWQVRSAITNTANQTALTPFYGNAQDDPNLIGAGLLDVQAAVGAKALLSPVSVSFGKVQSGAGKSSSTKVDVENLSGSTLTPVVVGTTGPATFTVSGPVTGTTGSFTVSATTPKGAAAGPAWATVELRDGSGATVAHLRVYLFVA